MDIFNFLEVLEARFFSVHKQSLQTYAQMYYAYITLYVDLGILLKKLNSKIKRAKKMKNKMFIARTKVSPAFEAKKKLTDKIQKLLKIYRAVLNRYAKSEIKEVSLIELNKLIAPVLDKRA